MERGFSDALEMATLTARKLGISPDEVLVASTGVIGMPLPMERVRAGIEKIALSSQGGHELAKAIMTTDTFPKEIAMTVRIGDSEVTIGGVAKGAGMIHPNMATLLCFLATDAAIDSDFLQLALQKAANTSFNMITVDSDTSPNDTVLLLANGLAGNKRIEAETTEAEAFQTALQEVCLYLAKCIVKDGEGATKLIEVTIEGALTSEDARFAARTIAGSPLVKAAVHGGDPNWGRIIAALGRSGAEIAEAKIDLYLDNLCLLKAGCPLKFDEEEARAVLSNGEVPIRVCLNLGRESATAWGCDLSEEYVTINSEYTT
jgi:glutamate N-acetyltransferase/amino-acid N-acetyltransferase